MAAIEKAVRVQIVTRLCGERERVEEARRRGGVAESRAAMTMINPFIHSLPHVNQLYSFTTQQYLLLICTAMTSRKPRRQNNSNHNYNNNNNNQSFNHHLTDYESDIAYLSDMQQQQALQSQPPAPPLRSNEELNLSVLQRHNPSVTSILSLAPYAVVYIFSPTTRQWEKNGMEGTLFVCQLGQGSLSEERYSVFVLNRRGLDNFDLPLTDGENVELTDEYVIVKADQGDENGENGIADPLHLPPQNNGHSNIHTNNPANVRIYGLWIYSEPPPNSTAETRTINAQMIRECAVHAGHSRKLAQERLEAMRQNGLHVAAAAASTQARPLEGMQSSVPMGRQISLKDLFGQQRAQDDGWSVRAHHLGPGEQQPPAAYQGMAQPPPPPSQSDVLGNLFRRAGLAYETGGQGY